MKQRLEIDEDVQQFQYGSFEQLSGQEDKFIRILRAHTANKNRWKQKGKQTIKKYYQIAASISLIFVLIAAMTLAFHFKQSSFSSPYIAYKTYFKPEKDKYLIKLFNGHANLEHSIIHLRILENSFKNPRLEEISSRYNNSKKIELINAIVLMDRQHFDQAEVLLKHTMQSNNPELNIAIEWYMALGYLRQGKIEKAKPYLYKLSFEKSPYRRKAARILKNLGSS